MAGTPTRRQRLRVVDKAYPLPLELAPFQLAGPPGALVPGPELDEVGADSRQAHDVPIPFDAIAIVAAPASGTQVVLIGPTGVAQLPMVPAKYRGVVDAIGTYVEGPAGPIAGPRIPGAGVGILWNVLANNVPTGPYGSISSVIPWPNGPGRRPILELRQGETLTVTVTPTDPLGLYLFYGVRIMMRLIPWAAELR